MRRAAKIDTTQNAIVDALLRRGYRVQSAACLGGGFPDLVCVSPGGARTFLIECKTPGEDLTPAQIKFHKWWPGECYIIDHVSDDAGWPETAGRRRPR